MEFPFTLDVFDLCTDELKQQLQPKRKLLMEIEDKKLQEISKKGKGGKEEKKPKKEPQPLPSMIDPSNPFPAKNDNDVFSTIEKRNWTI